MTNSSKSVVKNAATDEQPAAILASAGTRKNLRDASVSGLGIVGDCLLNSTARVNLTVKLPEALTEQKQLTVYYMSEDSGLHSSRITLDPGTAEKVLALTKSIVIDNRLTCLMITHNMQSALDLGNRTLMMDQGRIIYDVTGEERSRLTIRDLTDTYSRIPIEPEKEEEEEEEE